MWSHPLGVLITKTKWPYGIHLCLEPILFFSFFFSKPEHFIITMAITTIMIFIICSTTWNVLPYLMITWSNRLALRISSIHQNQTRAFRSVGSAMSVIGSSDQCGRFCADQFWYVYIWMMEICMINTFLYDKLFFLLNTMICKYDSFLNLL